jgi:AcrR family transcriptional regulator
VSAAVDRAVERALGRPRSAAADEAILRATVDEFAERGYEGLRVENVAERAGVAKSTIYRRYPSKSDLVAAALLQAPSDAPTPSYTGALVEDLLGLVRHLRDKYASTEVGRLIPSIVEAAARHPEFAVIHQRFLSERRRGGVARLQAAVDEGRLPADSDVQLLMDMVAAPIFYRSFVSGMTLDDATLRALVERAVGPDPA